MKRLIIIGVLTVLAVTGIILGVTYFNSLSKLNKSFSRYISEDVEIIVKTDNLNLLKNHVNSSLVKQSLSGAKNMDIALNKLMKLDSLMNQNNIPFEYYNTLKYYCMVEKGGHAYVVIESPYQFDQNLFFEHFKIDKYEKTDKDIYPFFNVNVFLKGRFAVISENIELLSSMKNFKRNKEVDELDKSLISDTYCQVFNKTEHWNVFDVLIESNFIQMPHVDKGANYESFGNIEDKEIFYFILDDVVNLEWVKSRSPFLEIQKLFNHQKTLPAELTNWVNGSIAKFENNQGAYMLMRTSNDIAPSGQLESATVSHLNISSDSIEHFKVNEHVIYQFDPETNYGILFNSDKKYKWYAELSNYIIFADSRTAMTQYFDKFDKGELINFNSDYNDFIQSFPSKCNYLNLSGKVTDMKYPGSIDPQNVIIAESKTYSDGIAFTNTGYYFTDLQVEDIEGSETMLEFKVPFDVDKFVAVPDHIDGGNSYLLSSKNGDLIFINKDGKEKWKAKVDSKVVGELNIVDLFGNNKKQIVFNTRTKLYMLDIKGNNVEKFPYAIPGEASNAVSVLDYDKNNNYRFLIATKKNKLLNIGEDGVPVQGWEFGSTGGIVKGEINHFIISGKDYIFFSDKTGKIYMLNRRGQERIDEQIVAKKQYHYFQKGPDILSTRLFAVTSEKIYTLTLDNQVDSIDLEIEKPYQFIGFRDFNNDGLKEFIFTSSGYINIINQFGLISRQVPSPSENVSKVELIYEDNKLKHLVLFDYVKEELYMLDINGAILSGYPIKSKKFLGSFKNSKNIVNCVVDEDYLRLVQN
jgi:hypothetical protein